MADNIKLYALSDDRRTDLLKEDIDFFVNGAAFDGEKFTAVLAAAHENIRQARYSTLFQSWSQQRSFP